MNASDEVGCPPTNCSYLMQAPALNTEARSQVVPCNRTTTCILASWKCDGHNDCGDYEDELDCSGALRFPLYTLRSLNLTSRNRILDSQVPPPCDSEPGYQKCGDSEECKPTNWWCDGDYDCENGADEADCPDCPASTPLMTLKTENNSKHSCLHGVYCDVHRSELLV